MDARNLTTGLVLGALVACCGCAMLLNDPSNLLTSAANNVVNGVAYDQAKLPEGTWECLMVPEGTKIMKSDDARVWRCAMHKEPGTTRATRKEMGCAVRREGRATLHVATFGAAGSRTNLTLYLPESMKVEFVAKPKDIECQEKLPPGVPMNAVPLKWTALIDSPDPEGAAHHQAGE